MWVLVVGYFGHDDVSRKMDALERLHRLLQLRTTSGSPVCNVVNYGCCHGVRDGYFHKCPQRTYADRLTGSVVERYRVAIADSSNFQTEQVSFINSPVPISACTNCVARSASRGVHASRAWVDGDQLDFRGTHRLRLARIVPDPLRRTGRLQSLSSLP